ncbi:glycosyltransferase family A protein [Spirosoma migulaei]
MVSVIIPTYNAASYLPALISALNNQTISHELIVLDSESTDTTCQILSQAGIQYISIPKSEFNHGKTRNLGVSLAKYESIIFMTQDALPASDDAFEKLIVGLQASNRITMAYGRQVPYPHTDVFGQFARLNNYPIHSVVKDKSMIPHLGIKTCSCSNSFAAYKKSCLLQIGQFPQDTILGEDVTVAAKFILQDFSVAYCADAQVYHSHDYSIVEEFKRYFDIGVFHKQQYDILYAFTRAESEGMRYVIEECKYIIKTGVVWLLPIQFIRTIAKYIGYRAGRMYKRLPIKINRFLSMHRAFW